MDHSKSEVKSFTPELAEALFIHAVDVFKEPVFYHFNLENDNVVHSHCSKVFEDSSNIYNASIHLSNLLISKSSDHVFKSSYFIVLYLEDLLLDDELVDGVALFTLEQNEQFFQLTKNSGNHFPGLVNGFLVGKCDKACLILNCNKEDGFKILNRESATSSKNAKFWKDNFLNVTPLGNDYSYTTDYVKLTSNFIKNRKPLDELLGKEEAVNVLNRSFDYFNENQKFDEVTYKKEVFNDKNLIEAFDSYKDKWQEKNQKSLASQFELSDFALSKHAKVFRSVIKLDRNFHIYVHGDHSKIEKGIDEQGRKYYILYYNEES